MKLLAAFSGRLVAGVAVLAGLAACAGTRPTVPASAPTTDILLLGCSHLAQLYKAGNPSSDVLTPRRQAELGAVLDGLQRYRPDGILVEELPEEQGRLDSLYQRYRQGQLDLNTLPGGRSEVYQLGFALGKRLGLAHIQAVNAPGGTSQSILHEGQNIGLYEQATTQWRAFSDPFGQRLAEGSSTIGQFLRTIKEPATLRQLHTLVYRTPARVTDGTLKPDAMVDAAFINPHYVGAEFISVFYNRDLKVYSNIVTTQLHTQQRRQLLIIGARHVASLQGILATDPAYRVVPTARYLGR